MGWIRFFRRRNWDEERARELQAHLEIETDENISRGMSPQEARYAAHRKLGNPTRIREEIFRLNSIGFLEILWQDLRFAVRMLRKNPGFTAVSVLTLGLAIGANTALFSAVNAVLFKPLPVVAPEELVDVFTMAPSEVIEYQPMAYPDYVDLRNQNKTLAGMIGFAPTQVALNLKGDGQLIPVEEVTGDYFEILGVQFALGRGFDPEQDRVPGGDPAAVLSYATWQQKFNADAQVIGKTVVLNESPITIVGVAPREFHGLLRGIAPGLWVPISMDSALHLGNPVADRGSQWLFVVGRLRPGVPFHEAQAELKTIAARLAQEYPQSNKDRTTGLLPASNVKIFPEADRALYATSFVLLGFVGLVLLIACANMAGMLLARASSRRKEIAVRTALGAGRLRLIRQLLTESLLLSLLGGILALFLTAIINGLLSRALENIHLALPVGFALNLSVDVRVLGFTLAVVLGTTFLFGLVPALKASGGVLTVSLKEETGTSTGTQKKNRILNALVVGQVTVSLVLLICAGLSLRSLWNASRVNPGFDPSGVATASFNPSLAGYTPAQASAFYQRLAERVRSLPGVQIVGLADDRLPLTFKIQMSACAPEGKSTGSNQAKVTVARNTVGPGYFEAMRIPILRGRAFTEQDTTTSLPVVMVNQTLANRFWPGQDPLGKRVSFGQEKKYYEVVGVAQDGKYITLGEQNRPFIYRDLQQAEVLDLILLARVAGDPHLVLASIREISHQLDARVPVTDLETVQEKTSVSLLLPRAGGAMFGLFGLLGLILASVGLYGVVSYGVSQRTHEIGIRMALGAAPRDISQLVMKRGLALVLIGVALGLAGAFAMTRVLSIILYGVSATDPGTFASVAIFLILVALAACYIPARRAMRVDPMVALRYE